MAPAKANNLTRNRITLKLKLLSGILKSFSIPFSTLNKVLYPVDSRSQNSPNGWICLSTYLKQWFDHFSVNLNSAVNPRTAQHHSHRHGSTSAENVQEICFCYREDKKVMIRTMSLVDESVEKNIILTKRSDIFSKGVRQLSTSLIVDSNEFEEYQVNLPPDSNPMLITVSMKEVGAMIELGTTMGSKIDSGFSVGGRPVYFRVENEESTMKAEFVFASTDGTELIRSGLNPKEQQDQARAENPNRSQARSEGTSHQSHVSTPQAQANHDPTRPTPPNAGFSVRHPAPHPQPRDRGNLPHSERRPFTRRETEEEAEDDELDQIPAEQWAQAEQDAIRLSQSRTAAQSGPQHLDPSAVEDEDELLMPSQAPPNKLQWKLFDD